MDATLPRIKRVQLPNGLTRPVIVVRGVPCILASLWIEEMSSHLRPNTLDAYARDVLLLYRFAHSKNFKLDQRLAEQRALSRSECLQLAAALSVTPDGSKASRSTIERRRVSASAFIAFGFDIHIELKRQSPEAQNQVEKNRDVSTKRFEKLMRFELNDAKAVEPSTTLTLSEQVTVQDVVDPCSPDNPFKNPAVRVRNDCMLRVLMETGARRAELTLMEISDVDLGALPTITIHAKVRETGRTRRDGASAKTLGRVIPISDRTAAQLASYIERERQQLMVMRRASPHLFISARDGRRMTLNAINHVFTTISTNERIRKLGKRLHPHGFRSTAASNVRREIQEADKAVGAELEESLAYYGGWAPGSPMVRRYTKEAISELLGRKLRAKRNSGGT